MATVLAVCNQKGGVGKTTTAVNLSACLAEEEPRCLLLDMDTQSNATTGVGLDKHNLELSVYDVITERSHNGAVVGFRDVIHTSPQLSHLDIAPASPELAGAEIELVNQMSRERKLALRLSDIRDDYEYIVIDSPPSLGLLTVNILAAADKVLIPIQCEYYALEGLAELLNTIRLVQKNLNSRLVILGVVLPMYDGRLHLCRQVSEDVRSCFSGKVFETAITRNVKLSEAPSFGKPIILYDIMSSGAENYLNLAKEIMRNE